MISSTFYLDSPSAAPTQPKGSPACPPVCKIGLNNLAFVADLGINRSYYRHLTILCQAGFSLFEPNK